MQYINTILKAIGGVVSKKISTSVHLAEIPLREHEHFHFYIHDKIEQTIEPVNELVYCLIIDNINWKWG